MADEIYINTKNAQHSQEGNLGPTGTFQQAYQGQRPATGRLQVQRVVSGQTPFTYQNPYPFTYPASARGRYPFDYQNPYPFTTPASAQGRYPFSYQNPYPFTYPANAQGRYPFTYQASYRTPSTYQARYPFIYQANAQGRYPFTYQANARGRTQASYPFTYPASIQGRYPFTYPANASGSYIARYPFTYPANAQTTVVARTQVAYPYISGSVSQNPYAGGQFKGAYWPPFRLPSGGTAAQGRAQAPASQTQAGGRVPATGFRQIQIGNRLDEPHYAPYSYQQPTSAGTQTQFTQQPSTYQANARGTTPASYPFTYQANARGRYPFTYQANATGR